MLQSVCIKVEAIVSAFVRVNRDVYHDVIVSMPDDNDGDFSLCCQFPKGAIICRSFMNRIEKYAKKFDCHYFVSVDIFSGGLVLTLH